MEITPEVAQWWLANFSNPLNGRKLSSHQDKLVRAIQSGEFEPTSDHISFEVGGMMTNGHNRCNAIARAGITVRQGVCFALPRTAKDKTDKGVSRTTAHTFVMHGVPNANIVAAAASAIYLYEAGLPFEHIAVSEQEAFEIYNRNPEDFIALCKEGRLVSSGCGIRNSVVTCLMYVARAVNRQVADQFFTDLKTGANLAPTSPVLALRKRISLGKARGEQLVPQVTAAFTIKAWNAVRMAKPMVNIRWDKSEGFPQMI
jgi:hypothetical protein